MTSFQASDYIVFCFLLTLFAGIGGYWGFKGIFWGRKKTQKTNRDFLSGAGSHRILPASLSLFASYVSAITILGQPTSVYYNGTQYLITLIVFVIVVTFANFIVVPTFYTAGIKTTFEYLKKRFGEKIFHACIGIYGVYNLLSMGMWLYIPAEVLSLLSGLNFALSITVSGAVVIFYTAFGGMRAIVYADILQLMIILLSLVSVVVKGAVLLGGLSRVYKLVVESGRPYVDLDPNPFTEKTTVWTILIGNAVYWASTYTTSQTVLTRYEPSSNLSKARSVLWLQIPYLTTAYLLWCFFGFVLYAYYHKCDPFITRRIARIEGFVPLYVSDIGGNIPGFLGFFMIGLFSGSMSSISSALNSVATIANEHLIRKFVKHQFTSEKGSKLAVRGVAVGFGVLSLSIAAFGGSRVGNSLKARISIANTFNCPTFGVFLLGLLNPRSNEKGALSGLCAGTLLGFYLIASHYSVFAGASTPAGVSVQGCPRYYCERVGLRFNDTGCLTNNYELVVPISRPPPTSSTFVDATVFFALSHQLGGFMTMLFTVVVGSIVSEFTASTKDRKAIKKYLASFLQQEDKSLEDHAEHI